MQANFWCRWLLACLLLVSICMMVTHARRGGGGRPSGGRPSYSRPSPSYSRPAPAPAYRPPPAPAYRPPPAPAYRPPPAPAPRPPPAPASAPKPAPPVVARQPAHNPDFKETNLRPGVGDRQPAYNPNYKPATPGGPPPPYSPAGHPVPNVPGGPPPKYEPSGSLGNPPPGVQPPPYPGPAVRPPGYPGLAPPYPVQPGGSQPNLPGGNRPYPVQPGYPGSIPNQPSNIRPYPVQPGYPGGFHSQPGVNPPYPVQPNYPGSFHSSNVNRPYPVQPGMHYSYPGASRPYPQQPLGGNVWQPHSGGPAPAYMNYGGIPTGANIYTKPHKKKGFLGSLMSVGKSKHEKKNKYYGSYPSPYGVGHMGGSGLGHSGGFLGKHSSSAAMYTIFPYMAAKSVRKIHKPKFSFMPIFIPRSHYHYHHYHHHGGYYRGEMDPKYSKYFDIYDDDYVGKCQQPIKKKYSEIKCNATFDDTECIASCEKGYEFANGTALKKNKCWHMTGVWRPQKNFPECKPVCDDGCMNGGECNRPGVCKCPPDFRGDRCQFNFLKCNIISLVKDQKIGWVCYHNQNETVCKIRCKEPAQFESPPEEKYKCIPDGIWTPNTVPQCVVKKEKDVEEIMKEVLNP